MKILKLNDLPKGSWVDADVIILHACFQVLKDCIEKENLLGHSKAYAKSKNGKIALELYQWWEERRKHPFGIGNSEFSDKSINEFDNDTKQLIRLIKIRGGLWT